MGEVATAEKNHRLAVDSAMSLWRKLAAARGAAVAEHADHLVVDGDRDQGGVRVVVGRGGCAPDDADRIRAITGVAAERAVTVEDHSARLDFSAQSGLTMRSIPVMVCPRGPPPPEGDGSVRVRELATAAELAAIEGMIVEDFPVRAFQPHTTPHRMLPPALLTDSRVTFLAARREGHEAGACLVLRGSAATGIYWLVTASAHRSAGVGRALMTAALRLAPEVPTVLCATPAGEPLYRSLGFQRVADSHWWSG